MPLQAGAHHSPAQPGAVADGDVCIFDAEYALLDEIENLAVERRLQAVANMAGDSFSQADRLLADRSVERYRPFDDRIGRFCSAYHFDQRDHVRRIEGMTDHAALGMMLTA